MKYLAPFVLLVGILAGQIIKFPPSVNGGLTVLDLSVLSLVGIGLLKLRGKLLKPPSWIQAAIVFFAASIISLILTPLKLETGEYLISLAYPLRFALYFLLGWIITSGAFISLKQFTPKILLFSGIGLAVLGIFQLIFFPNLGFIAEGGWDPHYFRTASTLLDPNFLGSYLVLTLIALTLDNSVLPTFQKKVPYFLVTYLAIVTTFSRSSAIMLVISFLIITAFKKSFKMMVLTMALAMGIALGFIAYQQAVAKPRNIDRQQSAEYRLNSWQQGWSLFQSSPIFGTGFNTYRFALKQYNLASDNFTTTRGASANDSSLLFVAATTGIIGFGSFLALLGLLFNNSLSAKRENPWGLITLSGLGGLIIHSLFINSLFYPWVLIWVILASIYAASSKK